VATLENGIQANTEMEKTLVRRREDIITYNRTKPIYKQYEETKTKFFKERFRKANEQDIVSYEYAEMDLRYVPRPLPTVKELDSKIARIKKANVTNNAELKVKKAELGQLKTIHSYLYHLRLTHQPPPPPKEQTQTRTKKRNNDIDL
jgi:FMN phosphatase YigB (HAD superfamily)